MLFGAHYKILISKLIKRHCVIHATKNTKVMKRFFRFTPIKLFTISFVALAVFSIEACEAQFKTMVIPSQYQPSSADLAAYKQQAAAAKSGAYDLTKSLPQGYVTDGSVDYTKYLQQGIYSNSNVVFPNFPVLVNHAGLILKSNSTVIFGDNSKLILSPSEFANYQILRLYNIQNVKLYFPVIVGDRKNHTGTTGEWGMGISIAGASNVEIYGPQISECWGDGIYIGRMPATSKDIKIYYPVLDHNRRNGISIVSVDGLTMEHAVACNTEGTDPMAGIDFEPNGSADVLSNIVINNPITFNNSKIGMAFSIWGMRGKIDKDANITIKNHIDDHSGNAFFYYGFRDNNSANSMNGHIQIINPTWKNNKVTFKNLGHPENGPKIDFSNVSIHNNRSGGDKDQPDSLDKLKRNFRNAKIAFH